MSDPASVELVGQEVGNYRITEKIGQGGMGAVYGAEHVLLGRKAAIKVLLPELCRDQSIINRLFNEARAATAIHHPGIVEIYDFGHREDGSAYIVMEYLEGESLSHRMRRIRPLPVPSALLLCSQISSVLAATHASGILHRDLKPDNVFLVRDPDLPDGERAKLLDFGIAKLTEDEGRGSIKTRTGVLMGSPAYMSPEQCKGAGHVGDESDLYSLGCILYQMLCGEPPFVGEGAGEVIAQHIFRDPVPVHQRAPQLSAAVGELVMRLLAKDPVNRPRSAAELKAELDRLRDPAAGQNRSPEQAFRRTTVLPAADSFDATSGKTGTDGGPVVGPPTSRKQARRRRWAGISLVSALALAVGAVAVVRCGDRGEEAGAMIPGVSAKATADAAPVAPPPVAPATTAPTEPAPEPEPPPAPAPSPAPRIVNVTITSQPSGARIYRLPGHASAGRTPRQFAIETTEAPLRFVLQKSGFRGLAIVVPGNEDKTYSFQLEPKREPKPPKPPRPPKPPTKPVDGQGRINPFDHDRAEKPSGKK